jgi:hypothetical protein
MTSAIKMRSYRLKDKMAPDVEFTGVQLGFATTETPQATRWTEVTIYRTEGGQYVIHRIGRSVLFHRHDGVCNTGIPTAFKDVDPDEIEDLERCQKCGARFIDEYGPDEIIDLEMDRFNVDVCAPEQVGKTLELTREDGTKFISHVAQRALLEALGADQVLRDSVSVRKIS